jgi:Holliday junction DNA helicase RuvB
VKLIGPITVGQLLKAIETLKPGGFCFIDEAHRLSQEVQELLYQIMGSGTLLVPGQSEPREVPPVTVVLATDKPGSLENALIKRFGTELHLDLYSDSEMREIVDEVAQREDLLLSHHAANKLARVCNGLPRRAEQLLRKLRMYYPDAEGTQMTLPHIDAFLKALGIDCWGFGERERKYLRFLRREDAASVATLAAVLGVDPRYVERQVEPKLRRHGLVRIGAGGRSLTKAGRIWVKTNLIGNRRRKG